MKTNDQIIDSLFDLSSEIRYVALYLDNVLFLRQRKQTKDSSSSDTDRFEELLVNPAILTLARQRGDIDCGGLRYIIIRYGNFYQLIKEINSGHISLCLEKSADLINLPDKIFDFLRRVYSI